MALVRHSEKFSADGNLSAEGFENLLGTPSLGLLAVLVREAVQNSCDATRKQPGRAKVCVRVRRLEAEQRDTLANEIFGELPEEKTAADYLNEVLIGGAPLDVLEIADFGTTGLAGPTRADVPTAEGENADFVNFFRNIGAARDTEGGGGTYGYGKATLYRASRAHAILVDTLTTEAGVPVRRLMAAQMGKSVPTKLTGRHWWGVDSADGQTVDPITGEEATRLAVRLGLPARSEGSGDFGTTIMILAPHMPADTDSVVGALTEYLLWNFWPRMMGTTPRGKKLEAWTARDREEWQQVPLPETFPPLDVLCRAMNALRGSGQGEAKARIEKIQHGLYRNELGRLAIARSTAGMRRWLLPPANGGDEEATTSIIPEQLHHVALMRPAQLVVRYEKGNPSADPDEDWGGVFMCSDDPEVELAFVKSEPPAHDDWMPGSLPAKSKQRSYVNVALRRISEYLVDQFALAPPPAEEGGPLARPSTMMGRFLSDVIGEGAGRTTGGGGGPRPGRPPEFTQPTGLGLVAGDSGERIAEFVFEVHAAGKDKNLKALPLIAIDGSMQEPDEATGIPEILSWSGPDGEEGQGDEITATSTGTWHVKISLPGAVAVGLRLRDNQPDQPS